MATTITSKGQATIPKAIRDYLGLRPGSRVEFHIAPDGTAIVRAAKPVTAYKTRSRAEKLRGMLNSGRTTDELMSMLRGYDADANDPGFKGM